MPGPTAGERTGHGIGPALVSVGLPVLNSHHLPVGATLALSVLPGTVPMPFLPHSCLP